MSDVVQIMWTWWFINMIERINVYFEPLELNMGLNSSVVQTETKQTW